MQGMDGITLASTVRKENKSVQIIFISGYSEYLSQGYDVSALHYLIKPIKPQKLFSVLDRASDLCEKNGAFITFSHAGETVRLPIYEISHIEANANYVTLHTDGGEKYTVRSTLTELESELDSRFFRTGRSFIVNLRYIYKLTKSDIFMKNGEVLPLPRGAYKDLNQAIITRL